MNTLLQGAAAVVVGRGYLAADHVSTATGLSPVLTISKNGGAFANPAAGASVMTEIESTGWYKFSLGTADTDTLGPLIVRGAVATMDNIEVVYQVEYPLTAADVWAHVLVSAETAEAALVDTASQVATLSPLTGMLEEVVNGESSYYRWLAAALEEAPVGGGDAPTVEEIDTQLTTTHGAGSWVGGATIAISATQAEAVASGTLAITTHNTWSQAITSTMTQDLSAATKLWLAIKHSRRDTDAAAMVFVEKTAGLTVVEGTTYATPAHGTLTVAGSSGAWTITAELEEAATALLSGNRRAQYELKALIAGDTYIVSEGNAVLIDGLVKAIV